MFIKLSNSSEEYWNEPFQFNPSRFEERHVEIYLPFSNGPRSCIGQNFAMLEAKIMLSMIIRRFHFEIVSGQKHVPDIAITLRLVFTSKKNNQIVFFFHFPDQNMECG